MKNLQAMEIYQHLTDAMDITEDLPVKAGFAILNDVEILKTKLKACEMMREAIVKKYAPDTLKLAPGDENYDKAYAELKELMDEDIGEVELKKIKLSDIENLSLTMKEIASLKDIIEE